MNYSFRKNLFKLFYVLLIIALLFTVVSCTNSQQENENGQASGNKTQEPLIFADAGWDSIRFHNHVAGMIIKHGYGYEYDITPGSTPVTIEGLKNGSIDIYMEIWKENVIDIYQPAIDSGDIIEMGVNFDDNTQGLYVPTYMIEGDPDRGIEPMAPDLKTVKDLKEYWDLFKDPEDPKKGRIIGSPPGWKADEIIVEKIKNYGLDETYNYFRPGSGTSLAASIASAYENGEPWVGYYWEPTWVMGKYDMTLLEEADYNDNDWNNGYMCEFPSVTVTIAVNKEMPDKAPDVVQFLKKYKTTSNLINQALAYMQDNEASAKEAAVWFLKNNEDVWTQWVTQEVAEKVKAALK